MGKKKGKKKSKAQLAQEATDLLAVGLDRAQLSVNNAGPGEDVAVLKLVIERKKAAFAKGAQRPSEELLVRSRAAEEPPPGLKKIETKEILEFLEALPKAPLSNHPQQGGSLGREPSWPPYCVDSSAQGS